MPTDEILVQLVDSAFAEAARRSGPWLLCRSGCTQCCMGEFPITQLDAVRLRRGLAELTHRDPQRAARVRERVQQIADRARSMDDDEACPVLDPETGACNLYVTRPITCRSAGPPMDCGDGAVTVCDLCYEGATDEQIAACAVEADPDGVEAALLEDLASQTGLRGETTIAQALSA